MNFDEHLARHRNADGSYDLAAAEQARYQELSADPEVLDELARKAASAERRAWESSNREHLAAQFKAGQGVLPFESLDLDAMVPLGGSVVVRLGDMNHDRIRLRKDLRTRKHIEENEAYRREMEFWFHVEGELPPDGTVGDL